MRQQPTELAILDTSAASNTYSPAPPPTITTAPGATPPLTEGERELYERLTRQSASNPQKLLSQLPPPRSLLRENYPISYGEGYVMAGDMHTSLDHAWIELGEKVIEPTLPTSPDTKPSAIYFGVKFSTETVLEKFRTDSTDEPLAPI